MASLADGWWIPVGSRLLEKERRAEERMSRSATVEVWGILVVPIADHTLSLPIPSVALQSPAQASPCLRCVLKEGSCGWMWVLESGIYWQCSWSSYLIISEIYVTLYTRQHFSALHGFSL